MTATQVDEESPLLGSQQLKPKRTPLPVAQFSLVLFLQLAEPLTSQVIYPFLPQLIRDIGITGGDETKVGYYVGLMQSLFYLTQAFTVLNWSRLSDRVGRKPVILMGLAGLSASMYCLGLSKTFWGVVMSRCLNGALNGNIGVMKSILAEMTDSTNISLAYAYQPIAWSTGGVLGPMIGGAFSRPAERYPAIFGNSDFLKKYPYFLPSAVPATFSAIAWVVTYFYLKETLKTAVPISEYFSIKKKHVETPLTIKHAVPEEERPLPLRSLLIRQVIVAAGNYAMLSLIDIAYRAILPVFLSTPIELGGLGLDPFAIGNIMSIFGLVNGVVQVFCFAAVIDYLGSKNTFFLGLSAGFPLFASFPLISYLAKRQGLSLTVWTLVGIQTVISILLSFSYGAIFIYIAAASPNRASLGATNGISQMTVSIFRAIGPAAANSLFSLSLSEHYMGGLLVYYVLMATTVAAIAVGSLLPRHARRP